MAAPLAWTLALATPLCAVLALRPAECSPQEPAFVGTWASSFGPLEIREEGEGLVGHYTIEGNPGHLEGEVLGDRLVFRYFGPGSDGEGWFEVRGDGTWLQGSWRPNGYPSSGAWNAWRDTAIPGLPALRTGEVFEGTVNESDPAVLSNGLLEYALQETVRGKMLRVDVSAGGPWFVELRADDFDSYLVLRDLEGNMVAQDDSGRLRSHARVAIPPDGAARYLLQVCSIDGRSGEFELALLSGTPPRSTLEALRRAEVASAERFLRQTEATWGPDHPETAGALQMLGIIIGMQGYLEEARPLFERALRIREEAQGPDHRDTSDALDDLARVLAELGLYAEARPLVERAVRIREEQFGPDDVNTAISLANLAKILGQQGLFEESEALFRRCLAICEAALGPHSELTAYSLESIGTVLLSQGRFDEARPFSERALKIWDEMVGRDRVTTAGAAFMLALVLEGQGHFEEARTLLEQCVETASRVMGPDHPYTSESMGNLARVLEQLGLHQEARSMNEDALARSERTLGAGHPTTAKRLNELAGLLAGQGELESAFECSLRAIDATDALVQETLSGLTENERLRYAGELRATLELFLSLCDQIDREDADRMGYERLLAWKGRVSRSLLSGGTRDGGQDALLLAQLRDVQRLLANELYRHEIDDREAHERGLEELRQQRNALELELIRKRNAVAEEGRQPGGGVRSLAAISGALPPGSVVVDFYVQRAFRPTARDSEGVTQPAHWTPPRLTAWVVQVGTEEVTRFDIGEAAEIERATSRFLEALVATRGEPVEPRTSPLSRAATDLRALLWEPLQDAIGDAELVFVSPDTFLGTLPFETLQLEDGSYLVEHHAFVYTQDVASLLQRTPPPTTADSNLLLVGGIDYRSRDAAPEGLAVRGASRGGYRSRWRPLSATRDEVEAIADIHAEALGDEAPRTVLTRSAATEERIKQELPGSRFVHLATHGYFQPEELPSMWESARSREGGAATAPLASPDTARRITGLLPGLLSGLVFAGANESPQPGRDNGLLTAEEVGTIDLAGCELVVLSACETGLGRAESGEGMLGLRRAFRQAGARTVVSSLWSVKDEATSDLMMSFYEHLWLRDRGTLQALRSAQLDMLRRNRAQYGHGLPATWGAFVLDGSWD